MDIIEISPSGLVEYASIPIAFEVKRIFAVNLIEAGLGGISLTETSVKPYWKNYDESGSPLGWLSEFDIQNWGIFLAKEEGRTVGAAAVAWNTNGVDMLEGRRNMAVLWDIRVAIDSRRCGIGKDLFQKAVTWSRAHGCVKLKIETQNINVNACRFYAAMGAELGDIRRFAYHEDESARDEIQLNWYLSL